MKGDFSRWSFDSSQHYTRVLQQQGRVQTDSDWNEQGEIAAYHRDTGLRDVIGRIGVPRENAGFGIRGLCGMRFDGSKSYIEVKADLPSRFDGNNYTVEAWVKLEDEKRGATIVSRLDHERNRELAGGFRLGVTPHGRLRFDRLAWREELVEQPEIDMDEWGDLVEEDTIIEIESRARVRIVGKRQLPVGRFCHVAAVCDGGWVRLFVDGQLDVERNGGNGAPFESMPVFIGCHPVDHHPARHFKGVIDQLRIWRDGIDQATIRAIMNGSVSRDAPNIAFHWDFDGKHGRGHAEHMPVPAEPEIWISAGRAYIDGVLCENESDLRYEQQSDCPGLVLPDRTAHTGPYLAYLDSWDRVVSAIEDDTILEPALGGPDTAVRLRTVCQVRLLPLQEGEEAAPPPLPAQGTLRISPAGPSSQDNSLLRIEIHDPGVAAGAPLPRHGDPDASFRIVGIDVVHKRVTIAQSLADTRRWAKDQLVELILCTEAQAAMTTTIFAVTDETAKGRRTLQLSELPPHDLDPAKWRLRPIATFKWSRDNGAWAFPVASIKSDAGSALTTIKVTDPNRTRNVLSENHWVELVDEDATLLGQVGPLCRISAMGPGDEHELTISLDRHCADPLQRSPDVRVGRHALLRPWDGIDGTAPASLGVKPIVVGKPTQLESVTVEFGAGHYSSGDYWVAPIRQRVQWPKDMHGDPIALPPKGISHRRAALALIWFKPASIEVRDLRPIFAPITEEAATHHAVSPTTEIVRELEREGTEDPRVMQDFGIVPPDHCILGPVETPPIGWRYTGTRQVRRRDDPSWIQLDPLLPEAGPTLAAALMGKIFCLQESGDFFAIDPGEMLARTACRKPAGGSFAGASMVALNGKLHLLGGFDLDGNAHDRHCQYDPASDWWHELAPLPTPRGMIATAALGGKLIAVGGTPTRRPRPVRSVDCYLPATDSWVEWPSLPRGRCAGAAGAQGGRLYLFGGFARCLLGLRARATHTVLVFSPQAERWFKTSRLAFARSGALVAHADERLYVVGGRRTDGAIAPIELFDLRSDHWQEAVQPAVARGDGGVAMLDGTIYVLGGNSGEGPVASIEACAAEQVFYVHSKLLPDAE
jgi:hypothetical protein